MKNTKYRNTTDTSVVVTIVSESINDVTLEMLAGVRFTIPWSRFHDEYRKVQ